MATSAVLRHSAISPQKMRWVADAIRGMKVQAAVNYLTFSPKKAARIIKKLLNSALANAENNDGADIDELVVKNIYVDGAPMLKRMKPRAKGRSDRVLKRRSHLTIVVATKEEAL